MLTFRFANGECPTKKRIKLLLLSNIRYSATGTILAIITSFYERFLKLKQFYVKTRINSSICNVNSPFPNFLPKSLFHTALCQKLGALDNESRLKIWKLKSDWLLFRDRFRNGKGISTLCWTFLLSTVDIYWHCVVKESPEMKNICKYRKRIQISGWSILSSVKLQSTTANIDS